MIKIDKNKFKEEIMRVIVNYSLKISNEDLIVYLQFMYQELSFEEFSFEDFRLAVRTIIKKQKNLYNALPSKAMFIENSMSEWNNYKTPRDIRILQELRSREIEQRKLREIETTKISEEKIIELQNKLFKQLN